MRLLVTNEDMIIFSIDYRLAPEYPYPFGHTDCFTGLKWIIDNAGKYGGLSDQIFVAGDSAGGSLCQYVTTRSLEENLNCIKGQMLLYPTVNMGGLKDEILQFDIEKYNIHEKHRKYLVPVLSLMSQPNHIMQDLLQTDNLLNPYLTPYAHVRNDLPPSFITVGEHDFLYIETMAYAQKLVKTGIETDVVVYQGLGHAYIDEIGNYPQSEDLIIEMGNFMRKQLAKK